MGTVGWSTRRLTRYLGMEQVSVAGHPHRHLHHRKNFADESTDTEATSSAEVCGHGEGFSRTSTTCFHQYPEHLP
ncbi:hypothetical protein [Phytomonospora endophytica]|uniref:Uncharacterized protein n=1 Tax=Phytomonospora endophytica TaxID=714109 RepID=A0A841FQ32_9ACTN|nr:hypothetical protein [Phytomonospora endophytica]MBB6035662.1 hypothetical protein [Phytomonospora endophytica]